MTLGAATVLINPSLISPRRTGKGDYVAEVWLEWPVCRGSTLYRQRFGSKRSAELFAKLYAMVLDVALPPPHFRTTDYVGRPCNERYDYGIRFCVRPVADCENQQFYPIWSPVLPNNPSSTSEHASAHPLVRLSDDDLNAYVRQAGHTC